MSSSPEELDRSCDVVVVGLGVGGEAVAGQLAKAGLDVVGIEAELVGGECPYWACIPSKMMIRAANMLAEVRRLPELAGTVESLTPDWSLVADRIRDEATDDWNDQVAVDRLVEAGATFVRGRAQILSRGLVDVPGVGRFRPSRGLVVATGTTAAIPPIPGLADTPYWTNREAVSTRVLPASLAIIGGGVIGCEIGQAFSRFGVDVTIVDAAPRLLAAEDADAGEFLTRVMNEEGIGLRLGAGVASVSHADGRFTVDLEGSSEPVHADQLLVATGRRPNLDPETWAALGFEGRVGTIQTDEHLRAGERLWAVGDITGAGAFTHVATYQADILVRDVLGIEGPAADYRALPRVAFTDPEVGGVGLTEQQARAAGINVAVGTGVVSSSSRGWIHKAGNGGLIKLIADTDTDTLVGALSVGPVGGEVLSGLAVAVQAKVPLTTLENMIYAYPTFHRGYLDALADLRSR